MENHMSEADDPNLASARPGTTADLSRRMDRMEVSHEVLAKEVAGLTTTIARVELNQNHAEEVNKLRFDSIALGLSTLESKVTTFITRIESIIDGSASTAQSRAGEQMVKDYRLWRDSVEVRLDEADTLAIQLRFLSRIIVALTGGSLIATACAVYVAFFKG